MTVNTLLKEQELDGLYEFLAPFYEYGLDAAIVQDLGVLRYLRRQFPLLDLHASTQMTNQGADGARLLETLGVTRVVTSRELTLPEIREIHDKTNLEIESFVHGALCYCYSGQCLLSSVIGGRSGNRGRCAQPCRLPYQFSEKERGAGEYLLSPKDICTLEILPKVLEAGVYSLKIEGRMKRPEYTAGVTRIYRKYLDLYEKKGADGYCVEEDDLNELMDLYNRGGFSRGYFETKGEARMMSTFRPNHYGTRGAKVLSLKKNQATARALEDLHKGDVLENATMSAEVRKGTDFNLNLPKGMQAAPGSVLHRTQNAALLKELSAYQAFGFLKEKINGKLIISRGKPVILSVSCRDYSVILEGPLAEEAKNAGLTRETVEKQMRKTGNTEFSFDRLDILLEENCFLPMQAFKELRREALERLSDEIKKASRREKVGRLETEQIAASDNPPSGWKLSALAFSGGQGEALADVRGFSKIYLEAQILLEDPEEFSSLREKIQKNGMECCLAMPMLFRSDAKKQFLEEDILKELLAVDGFLVRNLEEYVFLRDQAVPGPMTADANLYSYNQEARLLLSELGFSEDTAPLELNQKELFQRGLSGSELLVYGRIPLMVSSQCVKRTTGNCNGRKEFTVLKDRKGKTFPVWNDCSVCCNILYNTAPHVLLDNGKEIRELRPQSLRLSFTVETPAEAKRISEQYVEQFLYGKAVSLGLSDFTRGHFKRGVE